MLEASMARHKIRHFGSGLFNFYKGEPPAIYRPGSYRLDEARGGFWVSHAHEKSVKAKALEERRAVRLANRTRFGKGSGRAGGGRGAAHRIFHHAAVNNGMQSSDCPICLNRRLWTLWLTSDDGRWEDKWEAWPETELLRRELRKLDYKTKRSLMKDPGVLHVMKLDLAKRCPTEIVELKEMQRIVGLSFDRYMKTHRFEHKYIAPSPLARLTGCNASVMDYCVFVNLGIQFVYAPASTHGVVSL
jgi:hypothetical protein